MGVRIKFDTEDKFSCLHAILISKSVASLVVLHLEASCSLYSQDSSLKNHCWSNRFSGDLDSSRRKSLSSGIKISHGYVLQMLVQTFIAP